MKNESQDMLNTDGVNHDAINTLSVDFSTEESPLVTVVIPVYEDWDRAVKCLSCLADQTFRDFEVVAVDNGSSFVPEMGIFTFPFRLLHCDAPGSYAARNKGVENANGKIIAFTDSDCLPDEQWLENGVKMLLESPEFDIIAGEVQVFAANQENPTAVELCNIMLMFPQERSVRLSNFGVTANLFVRSNVLKAVNNFDARLMSSGDVEFCQHAIKSGFKLGHSPHSVVRHPAKRGWSEMLKTARRIGGGTIYRVMLVSRFLAFKMLFRVSVPPIRNIYWVLTYSDFTPIQKMKALSVLIVIKWVHLIEGFQVFMGKKPSRS